MFNYDDKYFATSPVGSFKPNYHDIYDLAGNVAEWVHDYYGAVGSIGIEIDPLGPELGQFHTIRGSSWSHGLLLKCGFLSAILEKSLVMMLLSNSPVSRIVLMMQLFGVSNL